MLGKRRTTGVYGAPEAGCLAFFVLLVLYGLLGLNLRFRPIDGTFPLLAIGGLLFASAGYFFGRHRNRFTLAGGLVGVAVVTGSMLALLVVIGRNHSPGTASFKWAVLNVGPELVGSIAIFATAFAIGRRVLARTRPNST